MEKMRKKKYKIDFSAVTPSSKIKGENLAETKSINQLLDDALSFLNGFNWCASIISSYLGLGIGNVIGVFLFKITPKNKGVDEWLWVVNGDLPSAYIVTDNAPTPVDALKCYIQEMRIWVSAVRSGKTTENIIPVDAAPTKANAKKLDSRLNFIEKNILPLCGDAAKH